MQAFLIYFSTHAYNKNSPLAGLGVFTLTHTYKNSLFAKLWHVLPCPSIQIKQPESGKVLTFKHSYTHAIISTGKNQITLTVLLKPC